jgi:hypothetical protein
MGSELLAHVRSACAETGKLAHCSDYGLIAQSVNRIFVESYKLA